ncbi:MAG: HAD family phosphatase [Verrucomicrobiota bacterium]|nr:HAD family phosphatase [Verrucomicrobiota bacterium]
MLGVIFDWDGVVIDSSRQHEESWELLAEEEGLPLFDGHFKIGFGKRNELIIRTILEWTSGPEEIARLGDRKEVLYREIIQRDGIALLPGVGDFVKSLQEKHVPYAIGSSTPRENIESVLNYINREDWFCHIVAAADVEKGKPDPEVFLKAAGKLEVAPERCVVLEDSLSGIEAGKTGGMKVVALTTTNSREILEKSPTDLIVDSFNEVTIDRLGGLMC